MSAVVVTLTIVAALVASYFAGRWDGTRLAEAAQANKEALVREAADSMAQVAAKAIAGIRVQHTTLTQEVQREVLERTVYRDCVHSAEQLQRINAAITGRREPEGPGPGGVPRADAAAGPIVRRDDAEADRGGRPLP